MAVFERTATVLAELEEDIWNLERPLVGSETSSGNLRTVLGHRVGVSNGMKNISAVYLSRPVTSAFTWDH